MIAGMEQKDDHITMLFWTGGWDSTYRLLELLLFEKRSVQPIYIIDPDRKSIAYELRAMQKIKKILKESYPGKSTLLLPTKYFELCEIASDDEITAAYHGVVKKYPVLHLGIQNEWMARLMKQYGMDGVEMSLQKSLSPFFDTFMKLLEKREKNGRAVIRVKSGLKGSDAFILFRNFHFALTDITKPEMWEKVKEKRLATLMNETWFCHNPFPSGKPCGLCVPCRAVMKEGMSQRMPLGGKLRYYFRIFLSADALKRELPKIHGFLKVMKHLILSKITRKERT